MVTVDDNGQRLKITDAEKNELTLYFTNWEPIDEYQSFTRPIDAVVAGIETSIKFPEAGVCIESESENQWRSFVSDPGPLHLTEDTHIVQVETKVASYVKFTGTATIYRDTDGLVEVSFPERTPVTIGFKSRVRKPTDAITVPPTLTGIATAVSALSSAIGTTGPERSYSTIRRHPPLLDIGEKLEIPQSVRESIPETGLELQLPDRFGMVFSAAPLVYYLQATLTLVEKGPPRLLHPNHGTIYEFRAGAGFQSDASAFLKHVFYLDCLVRNVGRWGTNLAELSILDTIDLDPVDAYHASPADRFSQYASIPREPIESGFPQWHLGMYVEPIVDHVPVIPHILDRLGVIYRPNAKPLSKQELLNRSVEDAYSSAQTRSTSATMSMTPILPALTPERVHGWIGDGVPIDVFKLPPDAFENRFDYLQTSADPLTFTVVLNDEDMHNERDAVTRIYTERADDLSIELTIESDLTEQALARTFEDQTDFIHYIGHCDNDGLKCSNGYLAIQDIEQSNAKTFFLNACDSYHEGIGLIKKGSIAGGVTLNRVFDEQATKIGTTFARLLVHGFSIEQALQIARRQTLTNKHYLVVGDGTYTLTQGDDVYPTITQIESIDSQNFKITTGVFSAYDVGGFYQSYDSKKDKKYLYGNRNSFELSKKELDNYLKDANAAIIYNDEYVWSKDLWSDFVKS